MNKKKKKKVPGSDIPDISRPRGDKRARRAKMSGMSEPGTDLALPVSLEIREVRQLAALARACLASAGKLCVDGSAVASADTAGLQLLVAIKRAALARGIAFEWGHVTPKLRGTSRLLGLDVELGFERAGTT